jgi:hypothetical protein
VGLESDRATIEPPTLSFPTLSLSAEEILDPSAGENPVGELSQDGIHGEQNHTRPCNDPEHHTGGAQDLSKRGPLDLANLLRHSAPEPFLSPLLLPLPHGLPDLRSQLADSTLWFRWALLGAHGFGFGIFWCFVGGVDDGEGSNSSGSEFRVTDGWRFESCECSWVTGFCG